MLPILIVHTASFADTHKHYGIALSIARKQPPRRRRCELLPILELMTPEPDHVLHPYLSGKIGYQEFVRRYHRFLDGNRLKIFNRFEEYRRKGIGEITIVGWDTDSSKCHRSIAAEWIRENNIAMIGSRN